MAVSYMSPYIAADETPLSEAVELFAETGHPVSKSTLERLCRKSGVQLTRHGRTNFASWSDLLQLHRDWVLGKN